MSENKKADSKVGVRIVKSSFDTFKDPIADRPIRKSDKSEQLNPTINVSASEWISHPVDMHGLKYLVQHSTILPQCIRAYKNNIAGFGISVDYIDDIEETEKSKVEWDTLERILALLNLDTDTKEVFEKIVEARETYGIAYVECIRNLKGEVVEIDFIKDTPSIDMTYPLVPYVDMEYSYRGGTINRRKKFRKFRQNVGGKTVYFKEFGDSRTMDKRTGEYVKPEEIDIDNQANEILDFTIGEGYYGTVRWIGQVLTIDGNYRAEILNNNYFRNGRHTPLMVIVKGGTLSDESFAKLQQYMDDIKGESGQHAFMILETEQNETTTALNNDGKQIDIEIKDLASILQDDELFQCYQENGRKKIQSSFLLPDLYVGYTTDFNRATAQTAMEITEKQVFQPERASLAWQINNKLLNGYGFQYVKAGFDAPDITNPDDITKILNVTERAGGMTLNDARRITMDTVGLEAEDYPDSFNMNDIGNVPLALIKSMPAMANYGDNTQNEQAKLLSAEDNKSINGEISEKAKDIDLNLEENQSVVTVDEQLQGQIEKAVLNKDDEIVAVMKEVRKILKKLESDSDE